MSIIKLLNKNLSYNNSKYTIKLIKYLLRKFNNNESNMINNINNLLSIFK